MQASEFNLFDPLLNAETLRQENFNYQGTGRVSQNNCSEGFLPVFLDTLSGKIYLSRFTDGRLAPIHLLDGLPEFLIIHSNEPKNGRSIKNTVISGFIPGQRFYTRDQAARYMTGV